METDPFCKAPFTKVGAANPSELYHAIGMAVTQWEITEHTFAYIYGVLVKPPYGGYAARRAFGTIVSGKTRSTMTQAAADVFFRTFPDEHLPNQFKSLLRLYGNAGSRRNEIAHGVVSATIGVPGFVLAAASYNTLKIKIDMTNKYLYGPAEINAFVENLGSLHSFAKETLRLLRKHYHEAPAKSRERY